MTLSMKVAMTVFVVSVPVFWTCACLTKSTTRPVGIAIAVIGFTALVACALAALVFVLALIWGF